jgi:hypothetical protein
MIFTGRGYALGMSNGRVPLRGGGSGELPRAQHGVAVSGEGDGGTVLLTEEPVVKLADLSKRPEWKLACRVAASKGICKSELLPRFLLYVCEQQLIGKAHEITEQRIGTQIFNRPRDYNPGEDNIVRSYARMLRKRLDEYFEAQGSKEPMRIVIPRGAYVPVFQVNRGDSASTIGLEASVEDAVPISDEGMPATVEAAAGLTRLEEQEERRRTAQSRRSLWRWVAVGVVCVLAVMAAVRWLWPSAWIGRQQSPSHAIWAQLFQQNRNTLIVPSDSGLGILQNLTGHLVSVEEYANKSYLVELKPPPGISAENFNDLLRQRYTSVVALNITAMLAQLPEFIPNRSEVRYARGITAEDMKDSNIILLGSSHTNPWVSLFENKTNFRLQYTPEVDESFVRNEQPRGSEQAVYRNGTAATLNQTYGVIDFLPGLDGAGHVLIIQGLNMAATQAAAETLFDAQAMRPILQKAARGDGSLKSFELLVETSSIGATAPGGQIIASRFYE